MTCDVLVACTHARIAEDLGHPAPVRGAAVLKPMGGALLTALHAPLSRRGVGVTIVYRLQDSTTPVLGQKYRSWGEAEFASFVELLGQDGPPPDAVPGGHGEAAAVAAALRTGLRSQTEVARALGLSTPTLRRRLAEEGLCFRQISAEVRQAELKDLLATNLPVLEVAERLGLSDDRSLRRFCAERLGVSPRQYRRHTA